MSTSHSIRRRSASSSFPASSEARPHSSFTASAACTAAQRGGVKGRLDFSRGVAWVPLSRRSRPLPAGTTDTWADQPAGVFPVQKRLHGPHRHRRVDGPDPLPGGQGRLLLRRDGVNIAGIPLFHTSIPLA